MIKTTRWQLIMPLGLAFGIAPFLVGCGANETAPISQNDPVSDPNITPAPPVETVANSGATPASRLDVSVGEGSVTVYLNDRKVGDYPSAIEIDVTPYVKVGENVLKLEWGQNSRGSVEIEYALAATPDKYADIAKFNLLSQEGKTAGSRTLSFNLPNADGSLPASLQSSSEASPAAPSVTDPAAVATSAPPVSQPPVESPVAENPTANPEPVSGVKAIMSVSANDAPIEISLNGTKIGDYQAFLRTDIGRYLKVGSNTLNVKWSSKTYLSVKIAYFSSVANDYRDISKLTLYPSDTRKPGSRTLTFTVPES